MTHQAIKSTNHCRLCSIFQRRKEVQPGIDTPWLINQEYASLISFGALVPGWTLLSPIEHSFNMQSSYADAAFWEFASNVETYIHARYGSVCIFEHGPNIAESLTGCGTGHAHTHMVPLGFSLTEEARQFDRDKYWVECKISEISALAAGREYLYVSDKFEGEQTRGFICILTKPTSQFFRKVIAKKLGMLDFSDYRAHPMLDIVKMSSEQLASDVAAACVPITISK